MEEKIVQWTLEDEEDGIGLRLDQAASLYLEDFSRSRISKAIKKEMILLNGKASKSSTIVKEGDQISADLKGLEIPPILPEEIPLDVLYEDEDILVVNKEANMLVHPTINIRKGTLVNALMGRGGPLSTIGGPERLGIVHRLDAQSSGALVIAKNNESHHKLSWAFKNREVEKVYLAICQGKWEAKKSLIDLPIGRNPKNPMKMSVLEDGKSARTIATTYSLGEEASLLFMQIITGRTHQIRVHARAMGHPIVGDPIYGFKKERHRTSHQLLHAYYLSFKHPRTGEKMRFFAPWDDEFKRMAKIFSLKLPDLADLPELFDQNGKE